MENTIPSYPRVLSLGGLRCLPLRAADALTHPTYAGGLGLCCRPTYLFYEGLYVCSLLLHSFVN